MHIINQYPLSVPILVLLRVFVVQFFLNHEDAKARSNTKGT